MRESVEMSVYIREGERRRLARQRDYANKSSFRSFPETSFISGVSGNNN